MKKLLPILSICFVLIAVGVVIHYYNSSKTMDGIEVTWDLLGQLDYVTGNSSAELIALNNKFVKIPGFMVPLEDSQKRVKEFLLVPSPQACIHVPPPPANQMVFVEAEHPVEAAFGPIWIYGKLQISPKKHMYGEASFSFIAESIEPYR